MMEAVNEYGQKEIERQEELSQHNIMGGTVQNPRSNYADNEVPEEFKELYENIAEKYSIEWEVLASIHRVETAFSSNNTTSSAGAIGHTQFMKCTWIGWGYAGCQGGLEMLMYPKMNTQTLKRLKNMVEKVLMVTETEKQIQMKYLIH